MWPRPPAVRSFYKGTVTKFHVVYHLQYYSSIDTSLYHVIGGTNTPYNKVTLLNEFWYIANVFWLMIQLDVAINNFMYFLEIDLFFKIGSSDGIALYSLRAPEPSIKMELTIELHQ